MEGEGVHAQLGAIMEEMNHEDQISQQEAGRLISYFQKQGLSQQAAETLNSIITLIGKKFKPTYEEEAKKYLDLLKRLDKTYVSSSASGITCQKWSESPFVFFHNMNARGQETRSSHFSVLSNPPREDLGCVHTYVKGDGLEDVIFLNPDLFLPLVRQMNFLPKAETSTLRVYTDFSNAAGTAMPHGITLCPIITTPFSKVSVIDFKDIFLCGTTMEYVCMSNAREVMIDAHALEPITIKGLSRCNKLSLRLVSIGDGQNVLNLSGANLPGLRSLTIDTSWKFYNSGDMPISGTLKKWNIVDLPSRDLDKLELVFNVEDASMIFGFTPEEDDTQKFTGPVKSILEIDPCLENLPFKALSLHGCPIEKDNRIYWPSDRHVFYTKNGCVYREHVNGEKLTKEGIAYPSDDDLNIFMWSRQFTRRNLFSVQTRVNFARILKGRGVECLAMNDTVGIAIGAVRPFLQMTDQSKEDTARLKTIDTYDGYLFDSVPTMRCLVLQHTIHTSMHTMPFPKGKLVYTAFPGNVRKTDKYLDNNAKGSKKAMHVEWDTMVPEVDSQRTKFEGMSVIIAADAQVRVPDFCEAVTEKKWMKERDFLHKNYQKKFESAKGLCGDWL